MFLNIYSVLTGELTDVLTYKLLITNILYRQMLTVNLVVLELTLALTLSQGLSRDIQLIAQHCNPVMGRFSHISLLF